MSALDNVADQLRGRVQFLSSKVKQRVFGANNENLDYLMDTFYKLDPKQRIGVVAGMIAGVFIFVSVAVILYFSRVEALRTELSQSFESLHELEAMKVDYKREQARLDQLIKNLQSKTQTLKVKPFFEKIGKDQNLQVEGLNDSKADLPSDSPLSKFKQVKVEMRLPKISIPKLLNFLVEVEKSNNYLHLGDLIVHERYEAPPNKRLFFDATVKINGYIPGG